MIKEDWIELEGYPTYVVSNHGYIHNIRYGRELKPRPNGLGYFQVRLSREGAVADFYIHLLVATYFLPGYRAGLHVGHENGDLADNAVWNLYLKNLPANNEDFTPAPARGRKVEIVETGQVFLSGRNAARYVGGDYSNVYKCLSDPKKTHKGYHYRYLEERDGS